MTVLETLANNGVARAAYDRVLGSGRIPRYAYAHFFMNTAGIRSRVHLQNYFSTFFPLTPTEATARVWLFDMDGRAIARKDFTVPPFGQLYIEIEDIVGHDLDSEGMIYIDFQPPAVIRKQLKTIPDLRKLTVGTPYWVSYHDEHDNYMYVHSIEQYRGKVFGAIWPVSQLMSRARPIRHPWRSWRLLDVALLEELQIVAMNHARVPGTTTVSFLSGDGELLWSEVVPLESRQSRRVVVPQAEIERWKSRDPSGTVRIGLDPVLSSNGKPYVIMRYGGGPLSLHHG